MSAAKQPAWNGLAVVESFFNEIQIDERDLLRGLEYIIGFFNVFPNTHGRYVTQEEVIQYFQYHLGK